MIADVLLFLREHLDERLRASLGESSSGATGDKVTFIDGEQASPTFKLGTVTELLINLEEERLLRAPDQYAHRSESGRVQRGQPDIRLILYVLFVARFKQYEAAWHHLTSIVEHFQSVRVFEARTTPELPAGIDKLQLELVTLNLAEQRQLWGTLGAAHHPAILYRVKLLQLQDAQASEQPLVRSVEPRLEKTS